MPLRPPVKSWSSTLRLPKSTFPPRPNPADQAKYLERCSDDLYEWQSRERKGKEAFVLHDGPPYANGELHIGHALNKILKDIICRVKVLEGRRVQYVPGWDCHGLPIEIKALEQQSAKNIQGENGNIPVLDAIGVRRAARSLAIKTVKNQMKGFREWGVMADWEKAWKTMDKSFEIKQLGVFQEMVKKGLIFRRYKPVYWSPSSKTALAEAELEYKDDHVSTAAYVKFPLVNVSDGLRHKLREAGEEVVEAEVKLSAVIWTTTPWTLPANRAIAVHSELSYSIIKSTSPEFLLVAASRLDSIGPLLFGEIHYEVIIESILGKDLVGSQYRNTLRGKDSELQPIMHADFVSAESGSGLVHCAPGHGMDDYEVCTKLGIKAAAPVDDLGCFTAAALPDSPSTLTGIPVLDGGSLEVLKILRDDVITSHKYKHKYPYDWRTKLPVIIRATEQWFADVGSVKIDALKALKDVRFIPDSGLSRLESFVKGRSEWCISRQRAWGVPIPALYDSESGAAVLTDASVAHIISVINERGIDAWWTDAADDPAWIVPGSKSGPYRRGKDTMDVWFDSGSSWTQTEQQADIYLEGTDQHRGWFQSSLLTYTSASGKHGAPFKTLITHGFTLDEKGKKMSKSIGNTIAPKEIIDGSLLPPVKTKKKAGGNISQSLGPDALRLWAASSDYTRDITIGQPILQHNHNALLKYRMTFKMLLGSMHPKSPSTLLTKLDQIALVQLQTVMEEVEAAYANFEFYKGLNLVNKYIATDLSAFYLEAMKDRLYCGDGGGVLEEIFHGLLRMLSPVTPILVEEAWDHRPQFVKDQPLKIQLHPFHRSPEYAVIDARKLAQIGKDIEKDIPCLLSVNTAIKSAQEEARSKKEIGSSLESSVVLFVEGGDMALFERYKDELAAIFVVSDVHIETGSPTTQKGIEVEVEQGWWKASHAWNYSATFTTPHGYGKALVLPPKDKKCPRCWRFVAPVEEALCGRCEEFVG